MARASIPKKLRFEILKRDAFKCRYCGRSQADGADLQVDHVFPVAKGGANLPENLVTSCRDCNLGKSANLLDETKMIGVDFEKKRATVITAQEKLKEYQAYEDSCKALDNRIENFILEPFFDVIDTIYGFSSVSLRYFTDSLGIEVVREAASLTASKIETGLVRSDSNAWRYFCGICHKKIKEKKPVKNNAVDLFEEGPFTFLVDAEVGFSRDSLKILEAIPEIQSVRWFVSPIISEAMVERKGRCQREFQYLILRKLIDQYGKILARAVISCDGDLNQSAQALFDEELKQW